MQQAMARFAGTSHEQTARWGGQTGRRFKRPLVAMETDGLRANILILVAACSSRLGLPRDPCIR